MTQTTKTTKLERALLKVIRYAAGGGCRVPRLVAIKIAERESGLAATQTEWFDAIGQLVARRLVIRSDNWLGAV